MGDSLQHSLLKLLNEDYQDGDFEKRAELAMDLKKNVRTLSDACRNFDIGIKVYRNGVGKIYTSEGKEPKEFILLLDFGNDKYEPLVYFDDDTITYTFDKDSYLI